MTKYDCTIAPFRLDSPNLSATPYRSTFACEILTDWRALRLLVVLGKHPDRLIRGNAPRRHLPIQLAGLALSVVVPGLSGAFR